MHRSAGSSDDKGRLDPGFKRVGKILSARHAKKTKQRLCTLTQNDGTPTDDFQPSDGSPSANTLELLHRIDREDARK